MARSDEQLALTDSKRFFWLFGIGAAGMVILKMLLSVQQLWVTVPPLLLMVIYGIQLAKGHHASNRPERAGDNIYYLGFLYTLVSLALALYEFGVNAPEKAGLISDFAIALSTTIAGVLGRVLLTQGDREIDEYEKEAKLHVADAIDDLRADLERSRETINEFASGTRQVLEQNRDEQKIQLEHDREAFERHFTESLTQMSEVMSRAVNTGSEKLKTELERLATNIADQFGAFATNVESLNKASEDLSSSLNRTVQALQSLPDPGVLLNEKVQGIVTPLEQAATRMTTVLDQQKVWAEQSVSGVEAIVEKLSGLATAVDAVAQSGSASLNKLQDPVKQVAERLQSVQMALATMAQQITAMHTAAGALEQMPVHVARSIDSLHGVSQALAESAGKITATLDAYQRDLDRKQQIQHESVLGDSKQLQALAQDRDILSRHLSDTNQKIQAQVTQLGVQLEQVSHALIGLARFVNQAAASAS